MDQFKEKVILLDKSCYICKKYGDSYRNALIDLKKN